MSTGIWDTVERDLRDLAHGPNCDRLKPEFQTWPDTEDLDYEIMNNDLRDAYTSWEHSRDHTTALYHLVNVTEICNERLSLEYLQKHTSSLVYFREMPFMSVEIVGSSGRRWHNRALTYTLEETVDSIVGIMCHASWTSLELAYGVKRIEPGMNWTIRPSGLQWVVNKRGWHAGMTIEALFRDVPKADNERYYIVMTRLNVKNQAMVTAHVPTDPWASVNVPESVYWLNDLYRDLDGLLRGLQRIAVEDDD
jgi:hypothetical protein